MADGSGAPAPISSARVEPSFRTRLTVRAGRSRPNGFTSATASAATDSMRRFSIVPRRPSTDQRPARVASGFVNAHSPASVRARA